jgi:hypothetical protein
MRLRDRDELGSPGESRRTARPAERRVGDQGEIELGAPLDDTASERTIVEEAERDLDGAHRGELECLVEPAAGDVRETERDTSPSSTRRRAP